ncbi:hypothetical protein PUV54_07230 [Hyphococcus flavus]|uniref:Uncharacterized protein n=1 Tax=Hyphococcus flavus TaxID=1866326 RepID=A0AAE9ZH74_9PROT|nr:hypothetical protein [Hyphococcus flavus]WDI32988.1 hypothetical protein PUV54_07230 [Hyphococcus flavus]
MRRLLIVASCVAGFSTSPLYAHPGSKILTTGSGDRTAMTGSVHYEDVNGVHIFRGGSAPQEDVLLGGSDYEPLMSKRIEIKIERTPFRRIRSLRTQGFYSGAAHPSRRYTQGFYSGPMGGR